MCEIVHLCVTAGPKSPEAQEERENYPSLDCDQSH